METDAAAAALRLACEESGGKDAEVVTSCVRRFVADVESEDVLLSCREMVFPAWS